MNNQELTWKNYTVARLSRLYSVLIPALLITLALQLIGSLLAPDIYAKASRGADSLRYILAALFLQNNWMLSAAPATNSPLWSLSYEAWYYVAFGIVIFARPGITRICLTIFVLAIAGPNILLLAPAWLAGAALFYFRHSLSNRRVCTMAFASGVIVIMIAATWLADLPYSVGTPKFFYSASFFSDWLLAIGVAMVIGSLTSVSIEVPKPLVKQLRLLGDYTFPLYLFHFPIIFFFTAITGFQAKTVGSALLYALIILAVVLAISHLTELARPFWKFIFQRLLLGVDTKHKRPA